MSQPETPCALCGETGRKITNAHIFGNLLIEELPDAPRDLPFERRVLLLSADDMWAEVDRSTPPSLGHMPVRVLCQPCNGWMNTAFEIPIRRVLRMLKSNASVDLTRLEQTTLASWVAIVAILSQYLAPRHLAITALADRQQIRQTGEPVAGTHVWLGRSGEPPWFATGIIHRLDETLAEAEALQVPARYAFGAVFGPFAMFLVAGMQPGLPLAFQTRPEGALRLIWPDPADYVFRLIDPAVGIRDIDNLRRLVAAGITSSSGPPAL